MRARGCWEVRREDKLRPPVAMKQIQCLSWGWWRIGGNSEIVSLIQVAFQNAQVSVGVPQGSWMRCHDSPDQVADWFIEKWTHSRNILEVEWAGFDDRVDTRRGRSRVFCWNGGRGFWLESFEGIRTFCVRLGSLKTEVEMGLLIPASVWVVLASLGQGSLGFA